MADLPLLLKKIENMKYEHDSACQSIAQIRCEADEKRKKAEEEIRRDSERRIARIRAEAEERVEEVRKELTEAELQISILEEKLENSNRLNTEVKRILREKSNKERDLPKRSNGYTIESTQQWDMRYADENGDTVTVVCWKKLIGTYFPATMPFTAVENEIMEDLRNKVLPAIGIRQMVSDSEGDYEKFFEKGPDGEDSESNGVFKIRFQTEKGYWTVSVFHTIPLDQACLN